VNVETDDGTTALIYAASGGHLVVVQKLLTAGADIHARNAGQGALGTSLIQERKDVAESSERQVPVSIYQRRQPAD
jgi:ankyrin repeat protein